MMVIRGQIGDPDARGGGHAAAGLHRPVGDAPDRARSQAVGGIGLLALTLVSGGDDAAPAAAGRTRSHDPEEPSP